MAEEILVTVSFIIHTVYYPYALIKRNILQRTILLYIDKNILHHINVMVQNAVILIMGMLRKLSACNTLCPFLI